MFKSYINYKAVSGEMHFLKMSHNKHENDNVLIKKKVLVITVRIGVRV